MVRNSFAARLEHPPHLAERPVAVGAVKVTQHFDANDQVERLIGKRNLRGQSVQNGAAGIFLDRGLPHCRCRLQSGRLKAEFVEAVNVFAGAAADVQNLCSRRKLFQHRVEQHVHFVAAIGERIGKPALRHLAVPAHEPGGVGVVMRDGGVAHGQWLEIA